MIVEEPKTENILGETSPVAYTGTMEAETFSSKILDVAQEHNITLLEAVVMICDFYDITFKRAAKLLSPKLISLIAEEEDIHGLDLT